MAVVTPRATPMSPDDERLAGALADAENEPQRLARMHAFIARQRARGDGDRDAFIVRAPLRICPVGAHVDHQGGQVTGLPIDRSILLLARIGEPGAPIRVWSVDFGELATIALGPKSPPPKRHWSNYLYGAVMATGRRGAIARGLDAWVCGSLPIGGLSSSAAVTVAYLMAIAQANGRPANRPHLVDDVRYVENEIIGLQNGILDQTMILSGRRDHLTVCDCDTGMLEHVPWPARGPRPQILIACAGLEGALVGTAYNDRVAECRAAAAALARLSGTTLPPGSGLRAVSAHTHATHRAQLDQTLRRRADHFFTEQRRVGEAAAAWRAGDARSFGALMTASGHSSIVNYECGCPTLIALYEVLSTTPSVYGARFSGGGFRGACVALFDGTHRDEVIERVRAAFLRRHPALATRFSLHVVDSADGARMITDRG